MARGRTFSREFKVAAVQEVVSGAKRPVLPGMVSTNTERIGSRAQRLFHGASRADTRIDRLQHGNWSSGSILVRPYKKRLPCDPLGIVTPREGASMFASYK